MGAIEILTLALVGIAALLIVWYLARRLTTRRTQFTRASRVGEWRDFEQRNKAFLDRLPDLSKAVRTAFGRTWATDSPTDRVIFSLGMSCFHDFEEIVVLSGNGYGFGALKILRGMYERLVTGSYLHSHPEETSDYLDYHHVAQYKVARELKDNVGIEVLTSEDFEELKAKRDRVLPRFMRRCPEHCR